MKYIVMKKYMEMTRIGRVENDIVVSTHLTEQEAQQEAFRLTQTEGLLSITLVPMKPVFYVLQDNG
jgi:hypothetical protein